VLCGDARVGARATSAAAVHGLSIGARCDVIARAGNPPLFSVWTLRHQQVALVVSSLTLRGPRAELTPDALRLREFSGFGRILS
jgi:hypothetical protein